MRLTGIIAVVALCLGFLAGWNVQGWRYRAAEADRLSAQEQKKDERAQQADTASAGAEADRAEIKTQFRTVYRDVEKIVERPVYRDAVCLDPDGMRVLQRAIAASSSPASEPAGALR